MVTNSYNRRRANKGTPPICDSKKPPPPPPPPTKCDCTLAAAYDGLKHAIAVDVAACTSAAPVGAELPYNITLTPGLAAGPPHTMRNCTDHGQQDFLGAITGVTYTITAEIFVGYHMICNRWTSLTAT